MLRTAPPPPPGGLQRAGLDPRDRRERARGRSPDLSAAPPPVQRGHGGTVSGPVSQQVRSPAGGRGGLDGAGHGGPAGPVPTQ